MYEVGQRYGNAVIMEKTEKDVPYTSFHLKGRQVRHSFTHFTIYRLKCDCGNYLYLNEYDNFCTNCGCRLFDAGRKDLLGKRFGKLVIGKYKDFKFECKCDCGNIIYLHSWEFLRDGIDSCEKCREEKDNAT